MLGPLGGIFFDSHCTLLDYFTKQRHGMKCMLVQLCQTTADAYVRRSLCLFQSFSMIMADAAPPALQIPAQPICPRLRLWARWVINRAPDILPHRQYQHQYK